MVETRTFSARNNRFGQWQQVKINDNEILGFICLATKFQGGYPSIFLSANAVIGRSWTAVPSKGQNLRLLGTVSESKNDFLFGEGGRGVSINFLVVVRVQ